MTAPRFDDHRRHTACGANNMHERDACFRCEQKRASRALFVRYLAGGPFSPGEKRFIDSLTVIRALFGG
jgi:hypothetical protein